jgi:hypothetical protein
MLDGDSFGIAFFFGFGRFPAKKRGQAIRSYLFVRTSQKG